MLEWCSISTTTVDIALRQCLTSSTTGRMTYGRRLWSIIRTLKILISGLLLSLFVTSVTRRPNTAFRRKFEFTRFPSAIALAFVSRFHNSSIRTIILSNKTKENDAVPFTLHLCVDLDTRKPTSACAGLTACRVFYESKNAGNLISQWLCGRL